MPSGRTFEPEDLLGLPAVSDPQISADGRTVAYVVAGLDLETDQQRSRVWVVPADGGEPRPLTPGPNDTSPRWSPDGATIAYVARAGERQHLCLQAVDGSEPRRLDPEYAGGIGGLCWSPDGKRLAFTSRTVPDGDRKRLPQVIRRLRYRHNGTGYIGDGFWRVYILDPATGETTAVSDPEWHHFQPAWSPDGQRLALVTTRRPDWDLEWIWDIFTCRTDGLDLQQLTSSEGVCVAPAWSPDGSQIAYLANRCPTTGTTVDYHLWSIRSRGGEAKELSAALDRGAITTMLPGDTPPPRWLPDGSGVCWLSRDRGFAELAGAGVQGGEVTLITGEGTAGPPTIASVTSRLAYTWSDAFSAPEVWTCTADGTDQQRLTKHTLALIGELALSRPTAFSLRSGDGFDVESWLWLPPGATNSDGPFPTLLELHGGPHGATGPAFSARPQLLTSHGYAVVGVNFRGSGGYGQRFADVILGDWGAKEFEDAIAALDHLIAQGIADPERLGVFGGSYGGFMTNYTITHSNRFAAAVTIATISTLDTLSYLTDHWESIDWDNGGYPFERPEYYREHSPLTYVARISTPLLILHGGDDYTCSVSEADMLFAALRKQRKEVELVRYPGEAHGFPSRGRPWSQVDAHRRLLDWFLSHIPVEATVAAADD